MTRSRIDKLQLLWSLHQQKIDWEELQRVEELSAQEPWTSNSNRRAELRNWDGNIIGMRHVPGVRRTPNSDDDGVLYMAPSLPDQNRAELAKDRHLRSEQSGMRQHYGQRGREVNLALPPLLRTCFVFCVTAWNPKGRTQTFENNLKAHSLLAADIKLLKQGKLPRGEESEFHARPQAIWEYFSWNLQQGWRFEGFCVAYLQPFAKKGREAAVFLGRRYGQSEITEYEPLPCEFHGDNGRIKRKIVPCSETLNLDFRRVMKIQDEEKRVSDPQTLSPRSVTSATHAPSAPQPDRPQAQPLNPLGVGGQGFRDVMIIERVAAPLWPSN
mmetsp:Transcript_31707/g.49633  ORF Transcript_31707/g.49633 Transcript_31707/m.49633 type:complete len:327 (+) Transcript_31707:46-1026(+)